jgi:hypothetical protein
MSREYRFRIIQVLLVASVLLSFALSHGQDSTAELQAFREDLASRIDQANLSFEQYQKTLFHILEQKQFYRESRPSDQRDYKNHEERTLKDESQKFSDTKRSIKIRLPLLRELILIISIAVLIAIVVFFVQQILQHLVSDVAYEIPLASEASLVTERAALEHAEQFAAQQDFRAALRALYLSALLHMHERGFLSYDTSLTNREYLHELYAHPSLQTALRPIVHIFDDIWYGYRPCNVETVTEYRTLLQKVYEVAR